MSYLTSLLIFAANTILPVYSQSTLLESVKSNQKAAIAMCSEFKELNKKGISASSDIAITQISSSRNLSKIDAEILSTYVIGLNCPDVR